MRRMPLRRPVAAAIWALLLLFAPALGAQETGRILGRVADGTTGQPLTGAQVHIPALGIGAITDVDGRYVLERVPAGSHDLEIQSFGYGSKLVTGVGVDAGSVTRQDITVEETAMMLGEIRVTAERERGSAAYLMDRRRSSSSLVDAIGDREIAALPASDAADVAQRMTGVTVSEGRHVYIRGLGRRYSQTALNGSPLPSTDPERESVPLDLFPSGFLESLTTQKSYTPDQPADFSGGSVQIETADFPRSFTLDVGVGTSFNSMSQFQGGFLAGNLTGGLDFVGLDDGSRALPRIVVEELGGLRGSRLPNDPAVRERLGQTFPIAFGLQRTDTRIPRSLSLSVGGTTEMLGRDVGLYLGARYSDDYTIRNDEVERKFRAESFDPAFPLEAREANVDYAFERGIRNVSWGFLGNATVDFSESHRVGFRTTVNLDTEDEARIYTGINREDLGGRVESTRSRFLERILGWGQLFGEHELGFLDSRLEWRGSWARAFRNEPGLREVIYLNGNTSPDAPLFAESVGESGRYLFSELEEDDGNAALDWRVPFTLLSRDHTFQVGAGYRQKARRFAARRFNWDFLSGLYTDLDSALAAGRIVGQARRPGEFSIDEVVEPGDVYDVSDRRIAGYAMLDLRLTDRLQAVGGVRVERYELDLESRGGVEPQHGEQTDVAPSLNLVFDLTDRMMVRGALSRTVDRPEFRELAPFQFTEAASLRQLVGNPSLETAKIVSADLRWDWFLGAGELLSAGLFHKRLTNPIEQVFIAAASTAYSFQNAEEAEVTGVEVDVQLGLRRLHERLEPLSLATNVSLIDSEVTVVGGSLFVPTSPVRPLEGQAAYVVNTGLTWAEPGSWEGGVFFNRLGERLIAAGGSGVPDIYEQPRSHLDATLRIPLWRDGSVRLEARNLLDAGYEFTQSANGVTRVQRSYTTGRTYSVDLSWSVY